ncbi:MAG: L,D-transpeptidase family protein [Actinomycetota bacterium]
MLIAAVAGLSAPVLPPARAGAALEPTEALRSEALAPSPQALRSAPVAAAGFRPDPAAWRDASIRPSVTTVSARERAWVQAEAERIDAGITLVAEVRGRSITTYAAPSDDARTLRSFDNPRPSGAPLVFRALSAPTDGWVEVQLPIRPNGSTGWIKAEDVLFTKNPYRLELDLAQHQLVVFRGQAEIIRADVALGTGETPTPVGEYYITELLRPPNPNGLYGTYAYGLSGYSPTLTSFNGGPGLIGIHGTNEPHLLGTNVSHGCIRVHNQVITEMAGLLPLGTPVSIRADGTADPSAVR